MTSNHEIGLVHFEPPKSFTAVACGTERIVQRRQILLDASRARMKARAIETAWAAGIGLAVFAFAMGPGFYWRFDVWVWELLVW